MVKQKWRKIKMQKIPKNAALVSGAADGHTKLEAIDNALLEAGIGNLNLITVSSILPLECKISELPDLKPGTITPVALAKISSTVPNQKIAASVSVARGINSQGIISEFKGKDIEKKEAEKKSRTIAKRMMQKRNLKIEEIKTACAEKRVDNVGAAIAGVVFVP